MKKIKNSNNGLVQQEMKPDEIDKVRSDFMEDIFPDDESIKECGDLFALKKLTPKQIERKEKLSFEIVTRYGLKNGIWVKNLSHKQYHEALGKMRHDIATEYSCRTSLELMLADRIVASYWRAMKCDMIFNRLIDREDESFSYNQLKVNVLKEVNKGIELADRQLNTNMILLKELKQPQLNIRVKTDNAYLAQNQQVNINPTNKDENIKPN